MTVKDRYQNWADRHITAMEQRPVYGREPLSSGQHILHLLLTVFTGGLWAPIWLIRGISGNRIVLQPAGGIPSATPPQKTGGL